MLLTVALQARALQSAGRTRANREVTVNALFSRIAKWTARATGNPAAFGIALLTIMAWAVTGPLFGFSDTWQLIINTGTTIATFLMVFLIQNTQNRDTAALQLKLDELIRVTKGAHLALLDLEELTENELENARDQYEELARDARKKLKEGQARHRLTGSRGSFLAPRLPAAGSAQCVVDNGADRALEGRSVTAPRRAVEQAHHLAVMERPVLVHAGREIV